MKRTILIAGPTASGKSAVAAAVAEALGGVVINTDSMQVYRDLRVLTARPTEDDERRIPHRMFGHVDAAEPYSVGRWLADLRAALADAERLGQVPVLVGGTGLYVKALTGGRSAMPEVPAALRARLRAEAATLSPEALHGRLATCDPEMAGRLRPSDPQRVLRALEIMEATGVSLAVYQRRREPPLLRVDDMIGFFLSPQRTTLYGRIDTRFDRMMKSGALDEVAHLAERDLDPALPAMRALGVPDLIRALRAEISMEEAVASGKQATRHYSRRQLTFARHQLPWLPWIDPADAENAIFDAWTRECGQ